MNEKLVICNQVGNIKACHEMNCKHAKLHNIIKEIRGFCNTIESKCLDENEGKLVKCICVEIKDNLED